MVLPKILVLIKVLTRTAPRGYLGHRGSTFGPPNRSATLRPLILFSFETLAPLIIRSCTFERLNYRVRCLRAQNDATPEPAAEESGDEIEWCQRLPLKADFRFPATAKDLGRGLLNKLDPCVGTWGARVHLAGSLVLCVLVSECSYTTMSLCMADTKANEWHRFSLQMNS